MDGRGRAQGAWIDDLNLITGDDLNLITMNDMKAIAFKHFKGTILKGDKAAHIKELSGLITKQPGVLQAALPELMAQGEGEGPPNPIRFLLPTFDFPLPACRAGMPAPTLAAPMPTAPMPTAPTPASPTLAAPMPTAPIIAPPPTLVAPTADAEPLACTRPTRQAAVATNAALQAHKAAN